jgi:hypothetical protein
MASSARAAPSIDTGGGDGGGKEPELKRRRLLDAGGPIEDDETARQKMRDAKVYQRGVDGTYGEYAGFDPDNVGDSKASNVYDANVRRSNAIKPMGYFAKKGDLPMMRWLYVNGADTRDQDVVNWFPMYQAAMCGHLDVCKWLFQHGAAGDIKRTAPSGSNPLSVSFPGSDKPRDLSRWLILRGALCKEGDAGDLDVDLMRSSLNWHIPFAEERSELLKWAREHYQSRSSFKMFSMGTLSKKTEYSTTKLRDALMAKIGTSSTVDQILANTPLDQHRLLWDDMFPQCVPAIAGKSGVLKLIENYVGIMRGREARIIRNLTELLPGVMNDLGDFETDSDGSSDDGD